jgi:hypothetical protein
MVTKVTIDGYELRSRSSWKTYLNERALISVKLLFLFIQTGFIPPLPVSVISRNYFDCRLSSLEL